MPLYIVYEPCASAPPAQQSLKGWVRCILTDALIGCNRSLLALQLPVVPQLSSVQTVTLQPGDTLCLPSFWCPLCPALPHLPGRAVPCGCNC
jgi:hypothetical protein